MRHGSKMTIIKGHEKRSKEERSGQLIKLKGSLDLAELLLTKKHSQSKKQYESHEHCLILTQTRCIKGSNA